MNKKSILLSILGVILSVLSTYGEPAIKIEQKFQIEEQNGIQAKTAGLQVIDWTSSPTTNVSYINGESWEIGSRSGKIYNHGESLVIWSICSNTIDVNPVGMSILSADLRSYSSGMKWKDFSGFDFQNFDPGDGGHIERTKSSLPIEDITTVVRACLEKRGKVKTKRFNENFDNQGLPCSGDGIAVFNPHPLDFDPEISLEAYQKFRISHAILIPSNPIQNNIRLFFLRKVIKNFPDDNDRWSDEMNVNIGATETMRFASDTLRSLEEFGDRKK